MTPYEDLIASADDDFAHGRFKDAHIKYGKAVAIGDGRNHYCRQMRGICARRVAEERLARAVDEPGRRQDFLNQAARWLAKSEANLDSAYDESPEVELGQIRVEQAQTEESIARFMQMCGGNPARRLSKADSYRKEGLARLAQA